MSKKITLLIFVLCFGLFLTGFNNFYAAETEAVAVTNPDFFEFDNTTGEITDYNQEAGITDVVIPSEINGYTVTKIGKSAFLKNNLTLVEIPDSVIFSKNLMDQIFILIIAPRNNMKGYLKNEKKHFNSCLSSCFTFKW